MKIIQLTAENVKRIKVADITPKGFVVQVTGRNAAGKSSVLDSIWYALAGEKNVPDMPLRRGEEKGRVRLDLGDMVVERKFGKGAGLTVRNKAGAEPGTEDKKLPKYDSPQEILDALLGRLSFDPLEFSRKKRREQYEDLKSIAKIGVDIEALEKANEQDFAARTKLNADAKRLRAQADGFVFAHPERKEPVDVSALTKRIQNVTEDNAIVDMSISERDRLTTEVQRRKSAVEKLRVDLAAEIARREKEIKGIEEDTAVMEVKCEAISIGEKVDVTPLLKQVDEAQILNREHDRRGEQKRTQAEAERVEKQAKELTDRMAARDKERTEAIQGAEMPIEGLSLSAGMIMFNGLPFDQASDAEQLRVSVAIAMAANPTLRVIRIKNASLLDEDGFKMLAELARDKDFQVWCEVVRSDGEVGIVMEDGEVVADHQMELEATSESK